MTGSAGDSAAAAAGDGVAAGAAATAGTPTEAAPAAPALADADRLASVRELQLLDLALLDQSNELSDLVQLHGGSLSIGCTPGDVGLRPG